MEFLNESGHPALWTMAFDRDGREMLVVAVKGTFALPADGGAVRCATAQVALTKADCFTGEPGLSAPLYETDFAPLKQRCDVVFNGTCHAPARGRNDRVPVAIRVGAMVKHFVVTGPRRWQVGLLGARAGQPEPFQTAPFSYDTAFGGRDAAAAQNDPAPRYVVGNPVGRGFARSSAALDGVLMPNTEEADTAIADPGTRYRPMALGPVGRNWQPRAGYAGTYDQTWRDTRAPYWPDDFDPRYFQSVPADQQIALPTGPVDIALRHLSAGGRTDARVPAMPLSVYVQARTGHEETVQAFVDTILIEPEAQRVCLTWRLTYRLQRHCFELKRVIVAGVPPVQRMDRGRGPKMYYRSFSALVRARRGT